MRTWRQRSTIARLATPLLTRFDLGPCVRVTLFLQCSRSAWEQGAT